MPVMTEMLTSPMLQDSPRARCLLQRAQGALQKWPEGFAGFRARLRCAQGQHESHGWVQLTTARQIQVHLPDATLQGFTRAMLERLVDERTPCFFKDGDGRFLLTLDAEAQPSWGQCVRVHRGNGERLAYWIDAKGRLRCCERHTAEQRIVTVFAEYTRATPGRVLPQQMTCTRFALAGGAWLGSETMVDTHLRINHVWLLATRHLTITTPHDTQTIFWEFAGHTLLGAC